MSTRSRRRRLDRLTQSANRTIRKSKAHDFDFAIDSVLANVLQVDRKRLDQLERGIKETEEERTLRARIAERASTINCPAGYGFNEVWDDRVRLSALQSGKLEPWYAEIIYDVEDPDAEEAQLIARIEAFNQSPEGRARSRKKELLDRSIYVWMCAADHSKLIGLMARYPEPPFHPKDPMRDRFSFSRSPEMRKQFAQSDKELFESTNYRRCRRGLREITENEASLAALEIERQLREKERQLKNHPDPKSEEAIEAHIQFWLTIVRRVLPIQRN